MKDLKYPKSFPTKEEEVFLKVLLSTKEDFPKLWQQWKERVVLDHLDKASSKLVPFLYLRLMELNITDDEIKRIRGVYRFTWHKNLLVMDSVRKVISLLNKENIPVIVLKGVPLLAKVYKNTAARSIGDADMLVDPKSFKRTVELMKTHNWKYIYQSPFAINKLSGPLADKYIEEITFFNDQNIQIDIHRSLFTYLFKENREHPMSYDEILKHSIDCDLKGTKCKMPCNEDMIIHIVVHGSRQVYQRTLRWVLDVISIIRTVPIDWQFLLERIKKFDVAVELSVAFSYLFKNYSIAVPESFIRELSRLPMEKDKIKAYYRTTHTTEHVLFGRLLYLWRGYWLYERKGNALTGWYYFMNYACEYYGITNKRRIPAFIIERYKQRISAVLHK
jgi:hypothetical protein